MNLQTTHFTYYLKPNHNNAAQSAVVIPVTHDAQADTCTLTVNWPKGKACTTVTHTWKRDRPLFATKEDALAFVTAKGWAN